MISHHTGNIFDSSADWLVNPTNSVGVMGGGLAFHFSKLFPKTCKVYNEYSKSRQDYGTLLRPMFYQSFVHGEDKSLIMFPTKNDWRHPSKLEYIESGLAFVALWLEKFEVKSIAFPMLGCGLGGLSEADVIPLFDKYLGHFEDIDVEIWRAG